MEISVLMAVYQKDNPQYLKESLDSILQQTLKPAEVVLVIDGPLPPSLEEIIERYEHAHKLFQIIRNPINEGLGKALKLGLPRCQYPLVARMDADDLSYPKRFEKQHEVLTKNPDIDLVGSWMNEFSEHPSHIIRQRKVPEHMAEIISFAKRRSPFHHPSVMFRKESILAVGSYEDFGTFEDYLLWAKFIMAGKIGYNIQEALINFRNNKKLYKRRGGISKFFQEIRLQNQFLKMKFIGVAQYFINISIRGLYRLLPNTTRGLVYRKLIK